MTIDIHGSYQPLHLIALGFTQATVGQEITITARHALGYLLDRADPPRCFSFKQTITDALNCICPQAPDHLEELPEEVQRALSNESEGQGMWKLESLTIEGTLLCARVKKL